MNMKQEDDDDSAMIALGVAKVLAIFTFTMLILAALTKATITFF